MKNSIALLLSFVSVATFTSCVILKDKPAKYSVDPVCNMKADMSEAFKWDYKGKTYYFDSYTCKEAFKMNPDKFINNSCSEVK